MKLIDGKNYFNEKSLNEMIKELENGEKIEVYIDSIGHTRNNNEQENYKSALLEKYADRLIIKENKGEYSYSYTYSINKK